MEFEDVTPTDSETTDAVVQDSSSGTDTGAEDSAPQVGEEQELSQIEDDGTGKPSKHIPYERFKKVNESYKQTQAQLADMQRQMQGLSGAQALHQRLSQDSNLLRHVMDLIEGKADLKSLTQPKEAANEEPEIDWDSFDPVIKNHHDTLKSLQKQVAELLQEKESQSQAGLQQHQAEIDDYFDSMLIRDGYMGEDKQMNKTNSLIQKATLAELNEIARDPLRPTRAEVDKAYKSVLEGLGQYEKHKLTKQVTPPEAPLSGTKRGSLPNTKKDPAKMSEQDRINYWANLYQT